jgi:putative zinc finger/helix-turn-helix YgiT family protein
MAMTSKANADVQPRCPVCGEAEPQPQVRTERFEHDGEDGKILVVAENVPVNVCPACGETFSGPEAGRIRDRALARALGLLSPDEIRALRSQFGMSQAEFARLTGIGEASISRWERGQLIQSRAFDRYLRLLAGNRANVELLEKLTTATSNGGDSRSLVECERG